MTTVLVVEDSRTQREMISELLKSAGLDVMLASDGVEALSLVQSHCPDVVILDIILPRMNGYEVCRQLKRVHTPRKPTVIMYSTKSEAIDFYWGSKQGADAYVSKLCHPRALIRTIEQLLQMAA